MYDVDRAEDFMAQQEILITLMQNKMTDEHIIINKTAIQKRIAELETKKLKNPHSAYYTHPLDVEIDTLKQILSQSTPLIPEIEKAFEAGKIPYKYNGDMELNGFENSEHYISNLKLDI